MKKLFMALGFLAIVGFIWNFVPCNLKAFARDGCCKERKSEEDKWAPNGKSYSDCKKDNKERDGDKISEKSGLVWWDKNC